MYSIQVYPYDGMTLEQFGEVAQQYFNISFNNIEQNHLHVWFEKWNRYVEGLAECHKSKCSFVTFMSNISYDLKKESNDELY